MDNFNNINAAIEYVEKRLDDEICLADVANIVGCSLYNFQRMFSFLTETSFSEYVRNRRLTRAAIDLQYGGVQVNDVSCKYGYNSPTAFTRAFTAFHGITPSEAKKEKVTLKVYPRLAFSLSIKGGRELDYRIETIEAFSVFGIEVIAPLDTHGFKAPAKLWREGFENGSIEKLLEKSKPESSPMGVNCQPLYGIANYKNAGDEKYPYMVCCWVQAGQDTTGYTKSDIPSQTYAVLKSEEYPAGDSFFAQKRGFEVQQQFYGEWLPAVRYAKTNGAELEVYYENRESAFMEIWYPVQKKE